MTSKMAGVRLERDELEIPFIPILCAAPLLHAVNQGFFKQRGLDVRLRPVAGWSGIKELMAHGKAHAAHMLAPMPLAASLGVDGRQAHLRVGLICNVNGHALTLAKKHERIRAISEMKGFVLGVPYLHSMQYYLLCDLLARHGLNPLTDVSIREVVPPRMPYYLKKGWLDGILSPEPYNELAVQSGLGFVYAQSKDLWRGHPCCALAVTPELVEQCPNTYRALAQGLLQAELELHRADTARRAQIARGIAGMGYWNIPTVAAALEASLVGTPSQGGLDGERSSRIDFLPHPWSEYAIWILAQMQRWGHLAGEVDYRMVADSVYMSEQGLALAKEAGFEDAKPSLDELRSFSFAEPFASMLRQPYCAFRPSADPKAREDLSATTKSKLQEIVRELAEVCAGRTELSLQVSTDDELGWLTQMLNEMARNMRFAREALDEQFEEQERMQLAVIEGQKEVIRELSTPILPVLDGVLVLPLLGRMDAQRARRTMKELLDAVGSQSTQVVLIDLTGLAGVDGEVMDCLITMTRTVALLGAECVLVGISPEVAICLTRLGLDSPVARTLKDLRSGVEYARSRTLSRHRS